MPAFDYSHKRGQPGHPYMQAVIRPSPSQQPPMSVDPLTPPPRGGLLRANSEGVGGGSNAVPPAISPNMHPGAPAFHPSPARPHPHSNLPHLRHPAPPPPAPASPPSPPRPPFGHSYEGEETFTHASLLPNSPLEGPPLRLGTDGTGNAPSPPRPPAVAQGQPSNPFPLPDLDGVFTGLQVDDPLLGGQEEAAGQTPLSLKVDLHNSEFKRAERAKREFEAVREAREAEFLRAHQELEALKMQQQVDIATLEAKLRESEQRIEQITQRQRGADEQLQRLRASRTASREKEEQSAQAINERLMQLEQAKENARQEELEGIRAKMRETTNLQTRINTDRVDIASAKSGNANKMVNMAAELAQKELQLDAREEELNREWTEIEARRVNLEASANTRNPKAHGVVAGGGFAY